MITDFFINLWVTIADWFVGFLPDSDPFSYGTGASLGMFATMNYFLPMGELFSVMLGVLLLGGPLLVATIAVWLGVGVLRGGSSKA